MRNFGGEQIPAFRETIVWNLSYRLTHAISEKVKVSERHKNIFPAILKTWVRFIWMCCQFSFCCCAVFMVQVVCDFLTLFQSSSIFPSEIPSQTTMGWTFSLARNIVGKFKKQRKTWIIWFMIIAGPNPNASSATFAASITHCTSSLLCLGYKHWELICSCQGKIVPRSLGVVVHMYCRENFLEKSPGNKNKISQCAVTLGGGAIPT